MPKERINGIATEYRQGLVLPSWRPLKQIFLCPISLPAAGKTTVVRPIAERLNLVRLAADDVRLMLEGKGFSYQWAAEIIFETAKELVDKGMASLLIQIVFARKKGLRLRVWF